MDDYAQNDSENNGHNEPNPEGGKNPNPRPGNDATEFENHKDDAENCSETNASF